MRALFEDTHNTAEGAGAAALAALAPGGKEAMRGRNVAVVLSGGNVNSGVFASILEDALTRSPAVSIAHHQAPDSLAE